MNYDCGLTALCGKPPGSSVVGVYGTELRTTASHTSLRISVENLWAKHRPDAVLMMSPLQKGVGKRAPGEAYTPPPPALPRIVSARLGFRKGGSRKGHSGLPEPATIAARVGSMPPLQWDHCPSPSAAVLRTPSALLAFAQCWAEKPGGPLSSYPHTLMSFVSPASSSAGVGRIPERSNL